MILIAEEYRERASETATVPRTLEFATTPVAKGRGDFQAEELVCLT